jgi:hypothetical protein
MSKLTMVVQYGDEPPTAPLEVTPGEFLGFAFTQPFATVPGLRKATYECQAEGTSLHTTTITITKED